jgi:3-keto-5-aminohexanoate cleavage enzyme
MMRNENKNVPYTPDEIAKAAVKCAEAGASIIHFHARNPDGTPCHDPDIYAEIVRNIHDNTDLLIDSTLSRDLITGDEERISHITKIGVDSKTRPNFAAIDIGSTNIDAYDWKAKRFLSGDKVYKNSINTCLFLMERMKQSGVKPHFSCWTIPFLRTVEAFLDMGAIEEPAYLQLALFEGGVVGAHPGTVKGLEAYLDFLPTNGRIVWSVLCKEGNLFAPAAAALERGGNIAVGLGDYTYPELGCPTNAEVVQRFADLGRAIGLEVATPSETRSILGLSAH